MFAILVLPQAYATLADVRYPGLALWFFLAPKQFKSFSFQIPWLSALPDELTPAEMILTLFVFIFLIKLSILLNLTKPF
jgi:hypothetical protein